MIMRKRYHGSEEEDTANHQHIVAEGGGAAQLPGTSSHN